VRTGTDKPPARQPRHGAGRVHGEHTAGCGGAWCDRYITRASRWPDGHAVHANLSCDIRPRRNPGCGPSTARRGLQNGTTHPTLQFARWRPCRPSHGAAGGEYTAVAGANRPASLPLGRRAPENSNPLHGARRVEMASLTHRGRRRVSTRCQARPGQLARRVASAESITERPRRRFSAPQPPPSTHPWTP